MDPEIRSALVVRLEKAHEGRPHIIVPEVDVWYGNTARIDELLVSDRLVGYEIKSDRDSLARLPRQILGYEQVSEQACLVVGSKHLPRAMGMLPEWWGVLEAAASKRGVILRQVRRPRRNPNVSPLMVSTLMPRVALEQNLRLAGFTGLSRVPTGNLRGMLLECTPAQQVIRMTREALLARADWAQRSRRTRVTSSQGAAELVG